MPNYSAGGSADFEWPPRDDVLERQVFKLGDPIEPPPGLQDAAETFASISSRAPQDDHIEEPHVALRRAIEAREAQAVTDGATDTAAQDAAGPSHSTPRPARARSRAGSTAIGALVVLASLQAAYIVRTWSGRPLLSPSASDAPPAAPVSLPAAVPARDRPESRDAPVKASEPAAKASVEKVENTEVERPSAASTATRVMVRSDPPGARVSIDGRYRGITPVGVNGLAPGEHRVLLERNGVEVNQTIRLGPGGTVSLLAPMRGVEAATGWISVESPIELDILEEGSLVGTSRSSRILLPSGPHTLQLVNQQLNFRDVRQVEVGPGSVLRVPVELPKSDVFVNATPWADVWIDGQHVGQTPIGKLTLPIGTHDVVFRHPDLGEKTAAAIVKAGAATRVTVDMRPKLP